MREEIMEIRHLKYFHTVASHLHFNNAAKELNISQPPLSKQIKQLEEELDVQLLNRTNRKVELTEAGAYFANSCKFVLNLIEKEVETTKRIHRGELGEIVLGFSGSVVHELLPIVIKETNSKYPDIKLMVEQHTSSEQIEGLLNGNINVGMLVSPVNEEKLNILPIIEEGFVAVVPLDHPLSHSKGKLDVKELANESFIMTPEQSGKGYFDSIISLCKNEGFYPYIVQNAQEQQTIISLVAADLGVAIVPESSTRITNKNVSFIPIKQNHKKTTALAWHKESTSPGVSLFIKHIRDLIDEGKLLNN